MIWLLLHITRVIYTPPPACSTHTRLLNSRWGGSRSRLPPFTHTPHTYTRSTFSFVAILPLRPQYVPTHRSLLRCLTRLFTFTLFAGLRSVGCLIPRCDVPHTIRWTLHFTVFVTLRSLITTPTCAPLPALHTPATFSPRTVILRTHYIHVDSPILRWLRYHIRLFPGYSLRFTSRYVAALTHTHLHWCWYYLRYSPVMVIVLHTFPI